MEIPHARKRFFGRRDVAVSQTEGALVRSRVSSLELISPISRIQMTVPCHLGKANPAA